MRAVRRLLTAASIAILGLLGLAGGAAADCNGPPPPFAETVASAKQIVIGDVVAVRARADWAGGRANRFTIQVSHVVRGKPFVTLDINDVMTQPCSGQILAEMGDRIALALDATAFTPAVEANGVAWIAGQPPEGFEMTTIENVYKLAGVPMPETTVAFDTAEATPPWLGPALWGLGVGLVFVIGAVVARRVTAAR
jgi:hypothetical protein